MLLLTDVEPPALTAREPDGCALDLGVGVGFDNADTAEVDAVKRPGGLGSDGVDVLVVAVTHPAPEPAVLPRSRDGRKSALRRPQSRRLTSVVE